MHCRELNKLLKSKKILSPAANDSYCISLWLLIQTLLNDCEKNFILISKSDVIKLTHRQVKNHIHLTAESKSNTGIFQANLTDKTNK